jgi:hypothetical protein
MRIDMLLAPLFALALVACGKGDSSGATTSAATTTAAPGKSAAATPAKPAAKATTKVNGKSMSDATDRDVEAALKKAGWESTGSSGMTIGAVATTTLKAKKGAKNAKIVFIHPSGKADDPSSSMHAQSAQSAEATYAAQGATKLDSDALLAVVIEGDQDGAKALLAALIDK